MTARQSTSQEPNYYGPTRPRSAVTCTLSTARILRIGALTVRVDLSGHITVGNATARVELMPLAGRPQLVSCIAESAGPAVCTVEDLEDSSPCPTPHAI